VPRTCGLLTSLIQMDLGVLPPMIKVMIGLYH